MWLLALAAATPALPSVAADPPVPALCDALVNSTAGGAPTCLVNRTRVFQSDSRFELNGGLRLLAGVTLACEEALCALEIRCASGDLELEPASLLRAGNLTLVADTVRIAPGAVVSASGLGLDDSPHDYYGDRHVQGAGHGGVGGSCLAFNAGGASYGDATAPDAFGSGRRLAAPFQRTQSARGGGLILLAARVAVQLDGSLRADGQDADGAPLGGGSGGSVVVRVEGGARGGGAPALNGSGLISVAGGAANATDHAGGGHGGGGGGRVLLPGCDDSAAARVAVDASGGASSGLCFSGGAGTAFYAGCAKLLCDNGWRQAGGACTLTGDAPSERPPALPVAAIVVRNGAALHASRGARPAVRASVSVLLLGGSLYGEHYTPSSGGRQPSDGPGAFPLVTIEAPVVSLTQGSTVQANSLLLSAQSLSIDESSNVLADDLTLRASVSLEVGGRVVAAGAARLEGGFVLLKTLGLLVGRTLHLAATDAIVRGKLEGTRAEEAGCDGAQPAASAYRPRCDLLQLPGSNGSAASLPYAVTLSVVRRLALEQALVISGSSVLLCAGELESEGLVTASSLGCGAGRGPGRGADGPVGGSGGGHGGRGGGCSANGSAVPGGGPYGLPTAPATPGSGGGTQLGGAGGGVLHVNVSGVLSLSQAVLSADGQAAAGADGGGGRAGGGGTAGGGGAGGSVWLIVGRSLRMDRVSSVHASGGLGATPSGGGGAGGRVRIEGRGAGGLPEIWIEGGDGDGDGAVRVGGGPGYGGGADGEAGSRVGPACAAGTAGLRCAACAPGSAQPSDRSLSARCEPCAPGSAASAEGSAACAPCAPGSAARRGSARCARCAPGAFAASPSASACEPCAPGSAANASGATGCAACEPGWAAARGSRVCTECAAGTAAGRLADACRPCTSAPPHARYPQLRFAGEPSECPFACEPGRLLLAGRCVVWAEALVAEAGGGGRLLLGGLCALLLSLLLYARAPGALFAAALARRAPPGRGRRARRLPSGAAPEPGGALPPLLLANPAADAEDEGEDEEREGGSGLLSLRDALRWDRHKYRARSHVCRVQLGGANLPGCSWALSALPAHPAVSRRLLKEGYLRLAHALAERTAWSPREAATLSLLWLLHPPSALVWRLRVRRRHFEAGRQLVAQLPPCALWAAVGSGAAAQRCDGYRLELGCTDDCAIAYLDFFEAIVIHAGCDLPPGQGAGEDAREGGAGAATDRAQPPPGRWARAAPAQGRAAEAAEGAPGGPKAAGLRRASERASCGGCAPASPASSPASPAPAQTAEEPAAARPPGGDAGAPGGCLCCVVLCAGEGSFCAPFRLCADDFLTQAAFGRRLGSVERLNAALLNLSAAMPPQQLAAALLYLEAQVNAAGLAHPHAHERSAGGLGGGSAAVAPARADWRGQLRGRLLWVRWPLAHGGECRALALAIGSGAEEAWVLPNSCAFATAAEDSGAARAGAAELVQPPTAPVHAASVGRARSSSLASLARLAPPPPPAGACCLPTRSAALWTVVRRFATFARPPPSARLARLGLCAALLVDLLSSLLLLGMLGALARGALLASLLLPPGAFASPLLGLALAIGGCAPRRAADGASACAAFALANLLALPHGLLLLALPLCLPELAPARALAPLPLCARLVVSQLLRSYRALPDGPHTASASWWEARSHAGARAGLTSSRLRDSLLPGFL